MAPESDNEKVLIWGAGGAVGGYAVQYAKIVGYTVIATASPRATDNLKSLGASVILDYKSPKILEDLSTLAPFKYIYTTSGDAYSQQTIAKLLRSEGGKFASVLPYKGEDPLPSNVQSIYTAFATTTQQDLPEAKKFARWWYDEYLGKVIRERIIKPTAFEKRAGGLHAIQKAADETLEGKVKGKVVINPQE